MHYEIIATLGPASANITAWKTLYDAGANSFRLNTSHLELDDLHIWLERLIPFLDLCTPRPSLTLDLQGSKWRLGIFPELNLIAGSRLELIFADATNRHDVLPVPHADFFKAADSSTGEILLDDARIALALETTGEDSLQVRVIKGGSTKARKGITYKHSSFRVETLSPKDQKIFGETKHLDGIRYAVSYVRDSDEMARYRALFGPAAYLIAKLERGPALEDVMPVTNSADELWLCRGDLGAELGLCAMAMAVQRFSNQVSSLNVPVMLAGQVLEHMTLHHHPTRSEICYLYESLLKGYRGIVLSDETAIGVNPGGVCHEASLFRTI